MMKRHILGLGIILLGAWSAPAYAGPLQLKAVPAEAKWVAHIDVDAMRSSDVIQRFYDECIKGHAPARFLDMVAQHCGMDPRKDLHHVTMYSTKIADGHGVLVVKAKMDEAKLLAMAKKAPHHRSMQYHDYEIHTWTHRQGGKDRQLAGVFQDTDVLVLASNADLLKAALDVLDGRSDSLQGADTPLAVEVPAGTMFLVRAMGIADSEAAAKHPLCKQLDRLDYAEGQDEGQWFGHLRIDASDEDAAQRIQTSLKGLRAMCWLHLDAVPELQQLLDQVKISREDNVVCSEFKAPVEELVKSVPPTCELLRKYFGERLAGADDFAGWGHPEPARPRHRLPRLLSPRPWLGVRVATGTDRGVSVERVIPGGPADRAGLKDGDAIIRVEKTRVEAPADLQAAVAGHRPGETIRLVVRRDDSRQRIKVALGAFGIWEGESEEPVRELLRRLLEGRFPYSEGS